MASNAVKKREIDMTQGALLPNLLAFAVPIMLMAILQRLFNSADMIVVGKFVSNDAMGSVGAAGTISNFIVYLAMGFGSGAGVAMSRAFGAKNKDYAQKVVHTAMLLSVILGIAVGVLGFVLARPLLLLMNTPAGHLEYATIYLRIIFIGAPFNLVYNFGASLLQATGDAQSSLRFLTIAGVLNVIVNVITVAVLQWGVAGVAVATIFSQCVSAVLVVYTLLRGPEFVRLDVKKLRIDGEALKEIVILGVPNALQNTMFTFSDMMYQTAINGFGEIAVNGSAVSSQIEGYVSSITGAFSTTAQIAAGQNYGANNYGRIRKSVRILLLLSVSSSLVLGWTAILFYQPLGRIFVDTTVGEEIVQVTLNYTLQRMLCVVGLLFINGFLSVFSSVLRCTGYPVWSMALYLGGLGTVRFLWLLVIFPLYKEFWFLFLMDPIAWFVAAVMLAVFYFRHIPQDERRANLAKQTQEEVTEESTATVA